MIKRRKTQAIAVGNLTIGGDFPIVVQSMTNTDTRDIASTLSQIRRLEEAGCELVRLGIPDMESAKSLKAIISQTKLPIAADIHFDAKLAQEAINQGVHKLRINPGNLRNKDEVKHLAELCKQKKIPIRIGVNAGSLDPEILSMFEGITPEALVKSAENEIKLLEECNFFNILISLKASHVPLCVEAYRLMSQKYDYPLHIGITEAGTIKYGTVKSSVGLGILLYEGIGDTLRVSLTADPVEEVKVSWDILKSLGIRTRGPELISCPTCARTKIDIPYLALQVEEKIQSIPYPIKVAVMGCIVNGPGEAKEADVGIAGGKGKGVIFREGKQIRTVNELEMIDALLSEIEILIERRYNSNHEAIKTICPNNERDPFKS
jgi:(E)-4-hydroxy-3-methylbut-2-enyl-diphosphate synthase